MRAPFVAVIKIYHNSRRKFFKQGYLVRRKTPSIDFLGYWIATQDAIDFVGFHLSVLLEADV